MLHSLANGVGAQPEQEQLVTLPVPGSSEGKHWLGSRQKNVKAGFSYEMETKDMINSLFKTIRSPIPTIRLDRRDDEGSG